MQRDKKYGSSKYSVKKVARDKLAKWLKSKGIKAYGSTNDKGKRSALPMPMLSVLKYDYEEDHQEDTV